MIKKATCINLMQNIILGHSIEYDKKDEALHQWHNAAPKVMHTEPFFPFFLCSFP